VRTSQALICALGLLASPYFFAYLEAPQLLGWPDFMNRSLAPWLALAMILAVAVVTPALLLIVDLLCESELDK
jgi:magnesium-transporting ATPase (P-type)